MKWKPNLIFYLAVITVFAGVVFYILYAGKNLQLQAANHMAPIKVAGLPTQAPTIIKSTPLAIFVLQLIITLVAAKLFGEAFKKAGQPAVIGEIIAGIVLGPSLTGALLPGISTFLFPAASLGNLHMVSQAGLIFFMFLVGMELNTNVLKNEMRPAIIISHSSIIIPFGLGVALAYFLYKGYATPQTPFYAFALFMGIAMSITAFPVLARILQEKGLTATRLGIIAITAAAVGDVTAWYILGILLSVVKGQSAGNALYTLVFIIVYMACMVLLIKPLLKKLAAYQANSAARQKHMFVIIIVVLLCSAYVSELAGLHVLFGAFVAGTIIPADKTLREMLGNKIDIVVVLFLPLFFVFAGLNTNIFLLQGKDYWLACILIMVVATVGKFLGSAIAARVVGESVKNSLILGVLLNTRGLMELLVLNIGYELGIFTPAIFTMMVLMALFTTGMAGHVLAWLSKLGD